MVVDHPDLLPLKDKGRAALEIAHGREHLAAFLAELFTAVAADDARVIVVL